jgi:hypothetical protein
LGCHVRPTNNNVCAKGVYLVFLFDQLGRHVYLPLNQAAPEVREEYGPDHQKVLLSRPDFARELLSSYGIQDMHLEPPDLKGNGPFMRGYCSGNIASLRYDNDFMPSENDLIQGLQRILSLYATYVAVGSGKIGESEELPDDVQTAQEAKKSKWHRRAERDQKLARAAKNFMGSLPSVRVQF